jgi:hypothetical protein
VSGNEGTIKDILHANVYILQFNPTFRNTGLSDQYVLRILEHQNKILTYELYACNSVLL